MRNGKLIALVAASTLISPFALAIDAPSYSYVEAGYISVKDDDLDADGFKLKGAFAFSEYLFFAAEVDKTSGDLLGFDYDLDIQGIGIGAKLDQNDGGSWFASYTLNTWTVGAQGFADEDMDVDTFRIGYRRQITDLLELNGSLTSNDVEGGDSENGYQVGMLWSINEALNVTLDFDNIDTTDMLSIGLRYNF